METQIQWFELNVEIGAYRHWRTVIAFVYATVAVFLLAVFIGIEAKDLSP